MPKLTKLVLLPLLLVTILFSFPILGCDQQEAAPEVIEPAGETTPEATEPAGETTPEATEPAGETSAPSQQELQQIIADSVLAVKDTTTYKTKMDMNMMMDIIGGAEAGSINTVMATEGIVDQAKNEMQMTMDMSIDASALEGSMQDVSMEIYALTDTMYMKMNVPQLGEQWVKMPFSEQMMGMYNLDLLDQQLAVLESAAEIKFLGYETVNGEKCYTIAITPEPEALRFWIGQQMANAGMEPESIDIADSFKELSYVFWITEDSKYVSKLNADMVMEMTAEQMDTTESGFEKMTTNISLVVNIYDHNKPVSIILPEAAQGAMEIPH